jgi:subtilisin family serine protease
VATKLQLEQLEDRTLLAARWLGDLAGSAGTIARVAPVVEADGSAAVVWDGGVHHAVAGQWVAGFAGFSGPAQQQVQALQQYLDSRVPADLHATVVRQLGLDGNVLIQVSTSVPQARVKALADLDRVTFVEPNSSEGTADRIPNDPDFSKLYGLYNTGQVIQGVTGKAGADASLPAAWDITTGSYQIVVADIDSGIDYTHPDLRNNVWLNNDEIPDSRLDNLKRYVSNPSNPDDTSKPITFADLNDSRNWGPFKITPHTDGSGKQVVDANDVLADMNRDGSGTDLGTGGWAFPGNTKDGDTAHANDYIGWNFVANNNRPLDDFGHGTHTAGTLGAEGDNSTGVVGVNWFTQIMAVKWLNSGGGGDAASATAAINYSVLHGARVSSNSWSIKDGILYQSVYDAIKHAGEAGSLFVDSASNQGRNNDDDAVKLTPPSFTKQTSVGPPLDNMIVVASTDNRDGFWSFSNYGPHTVHLGAAGTDVYSTLPNNRYGYMSGTSMSTPHVAGAATLLWGHSPNSSYQDIKSALLNGVDKIPSLTGKVITGGRLNVFHSLQLLDSSIHGTVFHDLDASGVRDDSKPSLAGWTVFIDANGSGVLDPGDRFVVTGPDGQYAFFGLVPGTYIIRAVQQDGWLQSAPADAYSIDLGLGQYSFGDDFGFYHTVSVSGQVFNDLNGSGMKDPGDPGLAGWRVFVDAAGTGVYDPSDPSVLSDADGNYTLAGLTPGTQPLALVVPDGWTQTAPDGGFYSLSLVSGQDQTDLDFGAVLTPAPAPPAPPLAPGANPLDSNRSVSLLWRGFSPAGTQPQTTTLWLNGSQTPGQRGWQVPEFSTLAGRLLQAEPGRQAGHSGHRSAAVDDLFTQMAEEPLTL